MGFRPGKIHAANSGAILQHPDAHFDLVRPGITVFGLYPTPVVERTVVLHPAMTLLSRIVMIRNVGKGRYISYGRTFKAPRRMRVATVPIGYGDGYPRSLSHRGVMIVRGRRVPRVGRVGMAQVLLMCLHAQAACGPNKPNSSPRMGRRARSLVLLLQWLETWR